MGTWRNFWRLHRRDRRAVLEAAVLMVSTHAILPLSGYRRWKSLLTKLSSRPPVEVNATRSAVIDDLARATASAARHLFFQPTCLESSIALWWLLRRRSFDAVLQIGGRKEREQFEAHAWVECNKTAIGSTADGHSGYEAFRDHPLAARDAR